MTLPIAHKKKYLSVLQFVTMFPELREGLKKIQDHNGLLYEFTGASLTLGGTTYILSKFELEYIPTEQEVEEITKEADSRHFGDGHSFHYTDPLLPQ